MNAKKKFLIIFFSILPLHILVAILILAQVEIKQKEERIKIEEIIDSVEVDDRFAYRYLVIMLYIIYKDNRGGTSKK